MSDGELTEQPNPQPRQIEFTHPQKKLLGGDPELDAAIRREEVWGNHFAEGISSIIEGKDPNPIIESWARTSATLEEEGIKKAKLLDAVTDELTTSERSELVGNERKFLSELEVALTKEEVALLYLDLDKFKEINDQIGHDAGDKTIEWFANILQYSLRQNRREVPGISQDEAFQIHGDEHAAILYGVSSLEDLKNIAERVREQINTSTPPIEGTRPTSSIGACMIDKSKGVLGNIRTADLAMLNAKQNGRDCTYVEGLDTPVTKAA